MATAAARHCHHHPALLLLPLRLQPPRKGEHSREVLREAGFDAAQIDAWIAGGSVITDDKS